MKGQNELLIHKSSIDKNFEIALKNKPEITKRNPMRNIKNYLLIISLTLTLISACTESVHQTEQSLESLDKEHLKKLEALVNPKLSIGPPDEMFSSNTESQMIKEKIALWRMATMGRLAEIGEVEWEIIDRQSFYSINK